MKKTRWPWWLGSFVGVVVAILGLGFYLSDKIYLRANHVSVAPDQFDTRYAPNALRGDFNSMLELIEKVHPDSSDIVDEGSYSRLKAQIVSDLDRPMTRIDLWRTASRINSTFKDGHTEIRRPEEEWMHFTRRGLVVPFHVTFDAKGMFIPASGERSILSGSRLNSLNGVKAGILRDWITERVSGETLTYRQSYAAADFAEWVWLYGIRPPYRVEWIDSKGAAHVTNTDGMPIAAWEEIPIGHRNTPLQLRMIGETSILTISSFEEPQRHYEEFLEQSFETIRKRKSSALIIDIRQNGGGASSQGDLLQSYISRKALPALRMVRVKATPEVKARYLTLMPPGFRWIPLNSIVPELRGIQTAPDNGFFSFNPEGDAPSKRGSVRSSLFGGDVYLLVGPGTYSSGAIFAAPLRHWGRATLIGQPTGEPLTFYGDNYEFDLPASKLQASVSHKQFILFGKSNPNEGVQPHILASPEGPDAMAIALAHIARKRRSRAAKP